METWVVATRKMAKPVPEQKVAVFLDRVLAFRVPQAVRLSRRYDIHPYDAGDCRRRARTRCPYPLLRRAFGRAGIQRSEGRQPIPRIGLNVVRSPLSRFRKIFTPEQFKGTLPVIFRKLYVKPPTSKRWVEKAEWSSRASRVICDEKKYWVSNRQRPMLWPEPERNAMALPVTFKSVGVAAHNAVIASLHRLLVIAQRWARRWGRVRGMSARRIFD